jgi:hypothetical protein
MPSHNTNLYKSNTIVMWNGMLLRSEPVFIESRDNSNERPDEWWYTVTFFEGPAIRVNEFSLRPMTFREFAWFQHPLSGKMMVGKNPAWSALVIHVMAVAFLVASPSSDPWWVPVAITSAMVAGFWFFTHRQFKGKQP